jgi:histone deacetylase 1/2
MINKGEVYSIFVHFHTFLVTQFSATLRIFQSDGGGEYISTNFKTYLHTKGIVHQMSCPYTPEQNGPAERKHRHIVETAVTLLQTAHLPNKLWFHACATSIYLINRLPCQILRLKSPFFLLYGSSPVIHHLRIFGCACFPLLRPYNTNKLQPKTSTCIFLGYAGQYKGYICFSLHTNRIFVSRHVLFDESLFPYISVPMPAVSPSLHVSAVSPSSPSVSLHNSVLPLVSSSPSFSSTPSASLPSLSPGLSSQPSSDLHSPAHSPLPVDPDFHPERLCVVLPLSPMNLHPMTTRSKSGISKKKAYSATVQSLALSQVEPRSFKIAYATIEWQSAM